MIVPPAIDLRCPILSIGDCSTPTCMLRDTRDGRDTSQCSAVPCNTVAVLVRVPCPCRCASRLKATLHSPRELLHLRLTIGTPRMTLPATNGRSIHRDLRRMKLQLSLQ